MKNKDFFVENEISIDDIQKIVCDYFDIDQQYLLSKCRKQEVLDPRHMCIYFCRKFTKKTLNEIGDQTGGRNHSTLSSSLKTVYNLLESDKEFKNNMSNIDLMIKTKIEEYNSEKNTCETINYVNCPHKLCKFISEFNPELKCDLSKKNNLNTDLKIIKFSVNGNKFAITHDGLNFRLVTNYSDSEHLPPPSFLFKHICINWRENKILFYTSIDEKKSSCFEIPFLV